MSGAIASDDFRDGASTGANIVAHRIQTLESWDIPITARLVADVARGVWHEYGGTITPVSEEPAATTPPPPSRRWFFAHRRREALKAWERYVTNTAAGAMANPDDMPTLFAAGFHMGVGAAQRADEETPA